MATCAEEAMVPVPLATSVSRARPRGGAPMHSSDCNALMGGAHFSAAPARPSRSTRAPPERSSRPLGQEVYGTKLSRHLDGNYGSNRETARSRRLGGGRAPAHLTQEQAEAQDPQSRGVPRGAFGQVREQELLRRCRYSRWGAQLTGTFCRRLPGTTCGW